MIDLTPKFLHIVERKLDRFMAKVVTRRRRKLSDLDFGGNVAKPFSPLLTAIIPNPNRNNLFSKKITWQDLVAHAQMWRGSRGR